MLGCIGRGSIFGVVIALLFIHLLLEVMAYIDTVSVAVVVVWNKVELTAFPAFFCSLAALSSHQYEAVRRGERGRGGG